MSFIHFGNFKCHYLKYYSYLFSVLEILRCTHVHEHITDGKINHIKRKFWEGNSAKYFFFIAWGRENRILHLSGKNLILVPIEGNHIKKTSI